MCSVLEPVLPFARGWDRWDWSSGKHYTRTAEEPDMCAFFPARCLRHLLGEVEQGKIVEDREATECSGRCKCLP
jgi:hypothetical protein